MMLDYSHCISKYNSKINIIIFFYLPPVYYNTLYVSHKQLPLFITLDFEHFLLKNKLKWLNLKQKIFRAAVHKTTNLNVQFITLK